jgi:hypothetical protein
LQTLCYLELVGEATTNSQEQNSNNNIQDKLSFGFTGDKERLKASNSSALPKD